MSTTTDLHWNLDKLGQWGEPVSFDVTRERIIAYAEATNDEHPAHRSGDLAPPVFPVVGALIDVLAPSIMTIVPSEVAMRVVHGEQDFHYHQPIRPGQTLLSRAAAVGVHGTPSGVVVLGKAITETQSGDLVVEQYMAAFFRGAELDVHEGETLPGHAFDESLRASEPVARSPTATTPTRPSATARHPATRCRSTSTTTSPKRWGCPGSSSTGCARWRSAPAR